MPDFNFSVFSSTAEGAESDSALVDLLHESIDRLTESGEWISVQGGMWCQVAPRVGERRRQGWKLHLSATPTSAAEVLTRSLPVLLASRSPFKFARTIDHVGALNARTTLRGHSGKFLTVYPENDDEAVRLAAELHEATNGLPGPRVLSDRPYAAESLVHYRYGAFVEERRITGDGLYSWMILDPAGNQVEDRRQGAYTQPAWVTCPFPDNGMRRVSNGGGGVLVGGRFRVSEAIHHTNKGGVYRAVDTRTGQRVVIKEARPHVASDLRGNDVRDLLRAEARALELLTDLGVAARPVETFEQNGHLFLAEEMIDGLTLRRWVPELMSTRGWGRHLPAAFEMATELAGLLSAAHGVGLVLRDFNPNNIMVRPDGRPVLIDLELAAVAGDTEAPPIAAGTPGFAPPEQLTGVDADPAADYFGFGATLCFLLTGDAPYLPRDRPQKRTWTERVTEWLAARTAGLDLPPGLVRLIIDVLAEAPEDRPVPSPELLRTFTVPRVAEARPAPDATARLAGLCEEAVERVTGHLLATMTPDRVEHLWPVSCANGAHDTCAIQHGAAGVLGVLVRCYEFTGDERVPEAASVACRWLSERLDDGADRPPALYFGTAGAAWALLEAGRVYGEERWSTRALTLADALPVSIPSPDITHGTSGIGLTALRLFAHTGAARFAERASGAADALLAAAEERPGGLGWATPADVDSKLAGKSFFGFAHGLAGVGCFLLACGLATGRDDLVETARRVGDTLAGAAIIKDGRTAMWGNGTGDPATAPYWCHGSSGIGTFLLRLHQATGEERFGTLAAMSARAVVGNAWRGSLGQCHGLAGNGDFLLDMAEATGDDRYEAAAWRLAAILLATRTYRDDHIVFPDEAGELSSSWGNGMSGILAFLLRLQHGGSRMWMVDDLSGPTR